MARRSQDSSRFLGAFADAVVAGVVGTGRGRRSQAGRQKSDSNLIVVIVVLAGGAALIQSLASVPSTVWLGGAICITVGVLAHFLRKTRKAEEQRVVRERAEAAERKQLDAHLTKHSRTLGIRYAALVSSNGYGVPDAPAWAKEVRRFTDSVGFAPVSLTPDIVHAIVSQHVEVNREQSVSSQAPVWSAEAMNDPMAFEQACAAQLRAFGWEASTTVGSGDQGIDVQARKAGVEAVVQCKLYSQPVGNGAAQEALSGKAFANADIAAVVSNAGFTRKAHELAAATGVLLLHYTEISRIDDHANRLRQAYLARKTAGPIVASSAPNEG